MTQLLIEPEKQIVQRSDYSKAHLIGHFICFSFTVTLACIIKLILIFDKDNLNKCKKLFPNNDFIYLQERLSKPTWSM